MGVDAKNARRHSIWPAEKGRPAPELLVAAFFGPLARPVVRALLAVRVPPPAVVLANAAVGLAAAAAIAGGTAILAALLLQLKTLLDNADGQLARVSGRVTLAGRYLDTETDLFVNGSLLGALGLVTGEPWLALAAFCALTAVLSTDHNVRELYIEARGRGAEPPAPSGGRVEHFLRGFYRVVFAPQDRLVRSVSERRLERVLAGSADAVRVQAATYAFHDLPTVALLANLGLSTQLAVLGVLLAFGVPEAYLWLVLACAALLPLLQLRRERLARHALL